MGWRVLNVGVFRGWGLWWRFFGVGLFLGGGEVELGGCDEGVGAAGEGVGVGHGGIGGCVDEREEDEEMRGGMQVAMSSIDGSDAS